MLRFCDGFDHYDQATVIDTDRKWTSHTNSAQIVPTAGGRFGVGAGKRLVVAGYDSRSLRKVLDAQDTWIMGVAFKASNINGAGFIFELLDGTTAQIGLNVSAAGLLTVHRGAQGGTLIATGTQTLSVGQWYYIEWKIVIDNSAGEVEVRIDGATDISATSLDTQATGNATADAVQLGCHNGGFSVSGEFDDLYVCDAVDSGVAGVPNDDFLGDVLVPSLYPNGNGNSSDLVGQDANSTDNYQNVDEVPPDDDTTYNESPTPGDEDTYAYTDLASASGTVYGVQALPLARKTDAGARSIVAVSRESGGTEEDSAVKTLGATYIYHPAIFEDDPDAVAWTISSINAAEFGVKVNA